MRLISERGLGMDQSTLWAIRILDGCERGLMDELRRADGVNEAVPFWVGLNHVHRTILSLAGVKETTSWERVRCPSTKLRAC